MNQFDPQLVADHSGKPIRVLRRFQDGRYFGVVGNNFFFRNLDESYRVIPEAYHLSFFPFPFWGTLRFEKDSAKYSQSEKPRRECIQSFLELAHEQARKLVPDPDKRPNNLFSFFRANEFGADPVDKEVHTHLLIKAHDEWADLDLVSLVASLSNDALSDCGIATCDFSANSDWLWRIAYVCKLKPHEREKKVDYSKGFNRWIKRHYLPLNDSIRSSLNPVPVLQEAA